MDSDRYTSFRDRVEECRYVDDRRFLRLTAIHEAIVGEKKDR